VGKRRHCRQKGVLCLQIKKRTFTREFKIEAVKLITEQGYSVRQAAESLGVCQTILRNWKKRLESQDDAAFPGKGSLVPADDQLRKLREENRRLRMERDILKKATAFFAGESS
jgi:transposase